MPRTTAPTARSFSRPVRPWSPTSVRGSFPLSSISHRVLTWRALCARRWRSALFSKDLFGVEESNTTITSDGLINFGKMRLIAKLVGHFTSCQVTFPIAIDPALRALLKGVQPLSENELYERSYRLEPRKNT